MTRCQADALDRFVCGDGAGLEVPPCDGVATKALDGFPLCAGCLNALEGLIALGERALFPGAEAN